MLHLSWPWMLVAVVAPIVVARIVPRAPDCAGVRIRVPYYDDALAWPRHAPVSRRRIPLGIALVAWCALVVAAARPQWVGDPVSLPVHGRDLMLALDLSASMSEPDMIGRAGVETRVDAVKRVAREFVARRTGDRIGLIVFGTRAYVQAPFTLDLDTVSEMIDDMALGLAGEQTAIGDAIGLAVKRLRARPKNHRVLVLLTDGADTASRIDPLRAARFAATERIVIHAVGVGTNEERTSGTSVTRSGSTALDESTLEAIAEATGGRYFRAHDAVGLESIYRRIDALEPIGEEVEVFRPARDLFHWPLGLSAILFAFAALTGVLAAGFRQTATVRADRAAATDSEAVRTFGNESGSAVHPASYSHRRGHGLRSLASQTNEVRGAAAGVRVRAAGRDSCAPGGSWQSSRDSHSSGGCAAATCGAARGRRSSIRFCCRPSSWAPAARCARGRGPSWRRRYSLPESLSRVRHSKLFRSRRFGRSPPG